MLPHMVALGLAVAESGVWAMWCSKSIVHSSVFGGIPGHFLSK